MQQKPSGREMDLSQVEIVCNGDTLALSGGLAAEETLVIGFAADITEFFATTRLDTVSAGQRLGVNQSLALPDGGGEIEVWNGDTLVDRVIFGDFPRRGRHGVIAENAYLSDTLLDSLSQRPEGAGSSLTSLLRRQVGPPVVGSGIGSISGTLQGDQVVQNWQGRYSLHRGRKAYEGIQARGKAAIE